MRDTRRDFLKQITCSTAFILAYKSMASNLPIEDMRKNVAIFIFNDAEVLDFAGPFEVFSVTSQLNDGRFFNVFTISKDKSPIRAVNGLSVNADYDFNNHPPVDILIISGGQGSRQLILDIDTLDWVKRVHSNTELTLSICSGARLLGKLGLLNNRPYCTHHEVYGHLSEIAPTGLPQREKRFVRSDDKIFTSGGITAGIDLSFHIVETLLGKETAEKTSYYMEYEWHRI